MVVGAQLLGQHAAQVIVVVVEHHDRACQRFSCHDIVRREDAGAGAGGDRCMNLAADAIRAPFGPGRQNHMVGAELENLLRVQAAIEKDFHVAHLGDLALAIVAHASPLGEAGQAAFVGHAPAQFRRGFGQGHPVAALTERAGAFQAGWAGADDKNFRLRPLGPYALRVPALAPFLAHGGVLRASHRCGEEIAGDTYVAADTFADVVDAPCLDLFRQERSGDRGPRGADEVDDAAPYERDHGIGRRGAADADHRLAGQRLDECGVGLLVSRLAEARGA